MGGIAEQRAGKHEPLPHAEGETADPAAGGVGEFDLLQHLVHPAGRNAVGMGQDPEWLRAVRPG